ncbi:MAG TPA: fatty acid--CoA ligase family protein [Stellaceae bacterium]|nr:fatty acid--CoA ligase family protein [Stellaceae bacterium]
MIRAGVDLREALIAASDRVLLGDLAGGTRTGQQILDNVDRLAGALLARGCDDAKIGLWYRNSLAAVEAFLAVEWIGGTRVPVDPHAPAAEAGAVFAAAGVDVVLADRAHAPLLADALIHDDGVPLSGAPTWPNKVVEDDRTLLLYPRAVEHGRLFGIPVSYANWRATMRTNVALYRSGRYGRWHEAEECFLAAQQIMHGTGFVGTFPFLEMGRPQVLADAFDAARILDAIDRFGVTTTVLVPPMMARLVDTALERPGGGASLKHLIYGGAPVAAEEIRRTMRRFGPILTQGYGRIEGGWPIATLGIDEHRAILAGDDRLASSCGRPIEQVKVKLRPTDAAADCGELLIAGEMTVGEYTDPHGWCSLGDIMYRDRDGYLFYRGRLDRMINTGYHVYPAEIEAAILAVSGIAAARVRGEADEKWGTTLVADVVLASEAAADADGALKRVADALRVRLAKYKIPRHYRVVEALSD